MAKLSGLVLCLVMSMSVLFLQSGANKPKLQRRVCFYRGRLEEKCVGDQTECGVNSMGASIGCRTISECGSVANMTILACGAEDEICCCRAAENPCNDYTTPEFEEILCASFPDATPCQLDAGVFMKPICKLPNGGLEECKKPNHSVCATDTLGRPMGCILQKECPAEVYFFDPKCNAEDKLCCCYPLFEIVCNDRTQSNELNLLLLDLEEKIKKEDFDPSAAKCRPDLWKELILVLPVFFYVLMRGF